jgi:hypothetical protein
MALSEQKKAQAKEEAINFLEACIYVLCLTLAVDPESIDSSFIIPVPENNENYPLFSSLKNQLVALERIQ